MRLLRPVGFDLREAANGEEAVEAWRQWRPHLIWMDLRMPVMDGNEATRRIRSLDPEHATKIIALTASGLEEERADGLAAGCDGFVRKPYQEAEIFDRLREQIGARFIHADEPASARPSPAEADLAALRSLPAELLQALEAALLHLDPEGVERMVREVRGRDPALADALDGLARNFQYGQLLQLIEAAGPREARRARSGPPAPRRPAPDAPYRADLPA